MIKKRLLFLSKKDSCFDKKRLLKKRPFLQEGSFGRSGLNICIDVDCVSRPPGQGRLDQRIEGIWSIWPYVAEVPDGSWHPPRLSRFRGNPEIGYTWLYYQNDGHIWPSNEKTTIIINNLHMLPVFLDKPTWNNVSKSELSLEHLLQSPVELKVETWKSGSAFSMLFCWLPSGYLT